MLLRHSLAYFLGLFLTGLELCIRMTVLHDPGMCLSLPFHPWVKCTPPCLAFKVWVLGIELMSSCLQSKHSPNELTLQPQPYAFSIKGYFEACLWFSRPRLGLYLWLFACTSLCLQLATAAAPLISLLFFYPSYYNKSLERSRPRPISLHSTALSCGSPPAKPQSEKACLWKAEGGQ